MAGTSINKLNARIVQTVSDSGRYGDGAGLSLLVADNGSKRWSFNFRQGGKKHEMGLGQYPLVGLAEARKLAAKARRAVMDGINPIKERAKAVAPVPTFGEYADVVAERQGATSKNAKHVYQWKQTLGDSYCKAIRSKALDAITPVMVADLLRPVWTTKAETAKRLRGRIETVFRAAKSEFPALREMPNPAIWKDNLDSLLGRRKGGQRGNQPAVPYEKAPEVWAALARRGARAGILALRFVILTAGRVDETLSATWDEFDLEGRLWTIPAERTKTSEPHVVPLSEAAMEVLAAARLLSRRSQLVFPSPGDWRKKLSDATLRKNLREVAPGVVDRTSGRLVTTHGWRSTFRDWGGDETSHAADVLEASLNHKVHGVPGAYRRGKALAKRRVVMADWANYLAGVQA